MNKNVAWKLFPITVLIIIFIVLHLFDVDQMFMPAFQYGSTDCCCFFFPVSLEFLFFCHYYYY